VHPGACEVAAASECANEQGKFWEFHDRVFTVGHEYKVEQIERDAEAVGANLESFRACMRDGRGLEAVKRDVEAGIEAGVTRTPTYFVNGIPIEGAISPVMFTELLKNLPDR
jgi:protein-disulfide isomerase